MNQESFNLNTICRFCLSSEGQQYLLFGLHKDPDLVIENVRQLTTIQLSIADGVDYKICEKCCADFELCVKFRENCIQCDQTLKEIQSFRENANTKQNVFDVSNDTGEDQVKSRNDNNVTISHHHLGTNENLATPDNIFLEQYGLSFMAPPLMDSSNWSEPSWMGFPWEQNELPHEPLHVSNQLFLSPLPSSELEPVDRNQASSKIIRSKYFCKICEKHFFQKNVHMQHHDKYSKSCFQCLDEKLIGVYRPETALSRHTCRTCLSVNNNCAEFLQHTIAHHAEQHRDKHSYKCDQCDKVFVMKTDSSRGKVHNCVKKLRCPHCPQAFYYAKSYRKHLQFYHNVQPATIQSGFMSQKTSSN
ncbi:zinc finger and SCAN domain-containing protein 12-like [Toxorhynchites rutilus septentrionalis]|uniref:zinc finger and SCAN domain-containing protein 12-like n=1 Tax=Toxorhynchites rutilus septentrionalis TaxID=329112 RepID=UPI0024784789|nr:zinc finger and SCAN domain-containing protein 12-like [Toxorhynchites rutilus septentrionalis]